jgi:putative transposase
MPRRPRLVLPDIPMHIIQRGNNRNDCFFCDNDYLAFQSMLEESARDAKCNIHAYVLMTNHIHLLVTPEQTSSPAKMMKWLGERYVQYVNSRHERVGTLWQGRYRSCLVGDDAYLTVCHRYIELNPVRAGMVSHPAEYRWSSYRSNALGMEDPLVTRHQIFEPADANELTRQRFYQSLFTDALEESVIDQVRHATNSNTPFGTAEFAGLIMEKLGRSCGRILDAPLGTH